MKAAPLIFLTALAACQTAPQERRLAGLDLNDPAVMRRATEGLSRQQRATFNTFALFHWSGSKAYCGRPMFRDAQQPDTVGEAIRKTAEFEQDLALKRLRDAAPPSPGESKRQRRMMLVDDYERLLIERQMALAAGPKGTEDVARIDRAIADNLAARTKELQL